MKVLTSEQMREVDRLTIAEGVPSIALMENAAHRVVEEMVREFDPIDRQNIVILCGKGNNGGDGLALARLLHEYNGERLRVVVAADPSEVTGAAAYAGAAASAGAAATGAPAPQQASAARGNDASAAPNITANTPTPTRRRVLITSSLFRIPLGSLVSRSSTPAPTLLLICAVRGANSSI
jgi:hypothetical protein